VFRTASCCSVALFSIAYVEFRRKVKFCPVQSCQVALPCGVESCPVPSHCPVKFNEVLSCRKVMSRSVSSRFVALSRQVPSRTVMSPCNVASCCEASRLVALSGAVSYCLVAVFCPMLLRSVALSRPVSFSCGLVALSRSIQQGHVLSQGHV
jgi:hypothetical protein